MVIVSNWNGQQQLSVERIIKPKDLNELIATIKDSSNKKILTTGPSRHSWSPILAPRPNTWLIEMDNFDSVAYEPSTQTIKCGAAATIGKVNALAASHGRMLLNRGEIDVHTAAGSIATSSHGSASFSTNQAQTYSDLVIGMEYIDARGRLLSVSLSELPAFACHLGCLGVVVSVTFLTVPLKYLITEEEVIPFSELSGPKLRQILLEREYPRIYLYNQSDDVHIHYFSQDNSFWKGREIDIPTALILRGAEIASSVPYLRAITPLVNPLFSFFVTPKGTRGPASRLIGYNGPFYFTNYADIEYAFDLKYFFEAVPELVQVCKKLQFYYGIGLRFDPGGRIWMASNEGRPTFWFDIFIGSNKIDEEFIIEFHQIASRYQGRPHWGKIGVFNDVKEFYSQANKFIEIKNQIDPQNKFGSILADQLISSSSN